MHPCARASPPKTHTHTHKARSEWKVFLESVLVEQRAGEWAAAALVAEQSLKVHSGTGRLWAALVQLRARPAAWAPTLLADAERFHASRGLPSVRRFAPRAPLPPELRGAASYTPCSGAAAAGGAALPWDFSWAQVATLRQALEEVPKSGEVWCEGGRVYLNPLAQCFDLDLAVRALDFAANFTPQVCSSSPLRHSLNLPRCRISHL